MVDTGDLGSAAWNRISNIPSTISIGSIKEYIDYGRIDIQNYTGDTIDVDDVPTKYQNLLINTGVMFTLSNMIGANVDFDQTLAEFRLVKSDKTSPEARQLEFYTSQVNLFLKSIGTKIHFKKVQGV